jgi:hypothetical protein
MLTLLRVLLDMQEQVLSGGHGLMVQGYDPIIKALAKDIDIQLNHRYTCSNLNILDVFLFSELKRCYVVLPEVNNFLSLINCDE